MPQKGVRRRIPSAESADSNRLRSSMSEARYGSIDPGSVWDFVAREYGYSCDGCGRRPDFAERVVYLRSGLCQPCAVKRKKVGAGRKVAKLVVEA